MSLESAQKNRNSFLRHLCDFGIGSIVGMGISMLAVPVTTRMLSPEEFGKASLFTLFQSLFLIMGMLGIDQGYVRYYNSKDIDRTSLFQNALFWPLFFCIVLIVLCLLFLKQISMFLFDSVELGLMIAFCVFIPVLLLNRFFLLQIRMDLRGKTYSMLNVVSQAIHFAILLAFLFFYQRTFRSIIYATIIGMCISTFICFAFCDKGFIFKKFEYSKTVQKNLIKFGFPLVPATLLSWLLNSFDKVGLRTWSDFDQLGLYSAAFKIVALLGVFQNIFATAWIPTAYKWHEEGVPHKKFDDMSTLVLAFMVIVFSVVVVFRDVIMLFLGAEYRNTARILVFLLFVPVMYTVSETTGLGIAFAKKTVYSLYVAAVAVLLNIIGNYLLIPSYGAEGAAVSTCLSYIVFFWGRTFFSRKVWFKFGLGKYVLNILLLLGFGVNMLLWQNKIIEILIFLIVLVFNFFLSLRILMEKSK